MHPATPHHLATTAPLAAAMARSLAPRKPLSVSQWADLHRVLSSKGSAEPGPWRTARNPALAEPMDCLSARSPVREVVLMFPIQFGKTEVEINALGYIMDHTPGPAMVCLPGEVSRDKWVNQKLHPMIEGTPAVRQALASVASRDAANTRTFKDFAGGQLYMEHAGSPSRLKSTSVKYLLVDELDEFAAALTTGDDPEALLDGRTSAFPTTARRLYISTPTLLGVSRIHARYLRGDQRRYHVPCPHCGHEQPLEWGGFHWLKNEAGHVTAAWYVCRDCGALIEEHHKPSLMAAARWVPENPHGKPGVRSYTINCLYYPIGLGPRWVECAQMWLDAQNDPARLKTFVNDRLAEPWEDPAMRAVKHNVVADRAEAYPLRTALPWVLAITAGIDTQDDRWELQILGWGRGMKQWCVVDYAVLPGDPGDESNWPALAELLQRPIQRADGASLPIDAFAMDAGGHRTEAVKAFVRTRPVRRAMSIFGAVPNNAPILSKPKAVELDWKGRADKRGATIWHVGTVAIKHKLYQTLSMDADKAPEERAGHFSDELPPEYFTGLISETYNPAKNRFEKKRGTRNEPLDTWTYAYAAAHHPELRLHRKSQADWDAIETRLLASRPQSAQPNDPAAAPAALPSPPPTGSALSRWAAR